MSGTQTDVLDRIEIQEPKLYNVILLNDDSTPMPFVIQVLIEIFGHNSDSAFSIMMEVHEKENGIAGTYYKEIAMQKENDTLRASQAHGYALKVQVELA